jgi:predicted nucleic acid-binding protein
MVSTGNVFADTAYWIALVDARDSYRDRAQAWTAHVTGTITTTTFVLTETANALCRVPWRAELVRLIENLEESPDVRIIEVDAALWQDGWALYFARPDKSWSLTDCISFVVMQNEGLTDALTTDVHFEQSGFKALLRLDNS